MHTRKPRIIVLGGGLGALSTVYWLTEAKPNWREEYESITVYQMGWRLGGKCASGRNAAIHQRIEEHGFHVWFGFYENAFRMMRGLYDALAGMPSPPYKTFASVEEAFTRRSVWTFEQSIPGAPRHWPVLFPVNDGVPGNGAEDFERTVYQNLVGWLFHARKIFMHREDAVLPLRIVAGVLRAVGLGATAAGAAIVPHPSGRSGGGRAGPPSSLAATVRPASPPDAHRHHLGGAERRGGRRRGRAGPVHDRPRRHCAHRHPPGPPVGAAVDTATRVPAEPRATRIPRRRAELRTELRVGRRRGVSCMARATRRASRHGRIPAPSPGVRHRLRVRRWEPRSSRPRSGHHGPRPAPPAVRLQARLHARDASRHGGHDLHAPLCGAAPTRRRLRLLPPGRGRASRPARCTDRGDRLRPSARAPDENILSGGRGEGTALLAERAPLGADLSGARCRVAEASRRRGPRVRPRVERHAVAWANEAPRGGRGRSRDAGASDRRAAPHVPGAPREEPALEGHGGARPVGSHLRRPDVAHRGHRYARLEEGSVGRLEVARCPGEEGARSGEPTARARSRALRLRQESERVGRHEPRDRARGLAC